MALFTLDEHTQLVRLVDSNDLCVAALQNRMVLHLLKTVAQGSEGMGMWVAS